MRKYSVENERIKRRYVRYLKEAKGQSEASVDKALAALVRFEEATGYKDFKLFTNEQAVKFKREMEKATNPKTNRPYSRATISSTLRAVKAFFKWLADQQGYKSRISYSDAEYFNMSTAQERIAQAHREKPSSTIPQFCHVFEHMPAETDLERRNRAVMALILLTGGRDSAVASLRLKHVDIIEGVVHFDAREVKTKHAKTYSTWFFPVPPQFRECLVDWVTHLREDLLRGNDDPLFPRTRIGVGPGGGFTALGLDDKGWANPDPIRKIFSEAFERVGLANHGPHSVRRTLALLGEETCTTPEEFKAWSQNLGHDDVLTTFNSYGTVGSRRQAQIIRTLKAQKLA